MVGADPRDGESLVGFFLGFFVFERMYYYLHSLGCPFSVASSMVNVLLSSVVQHLPNVNF